MLLPKSFSVGTFFGQPLFLRRLKPVNDTNYNDFSANVPSVVAKFNGM